MNEIHQKYEIVFIETVCSEGKGIFKFWLVAEDFLLISNNDFGFS